MGNKAHPCFVLEVMMKPTIIIFEGVDKSGKTTLLNMFNKRTDFKYVVLDRFTISSKVYNLMFKRDDKNMEYYNNVEQTLLKNFNVIIVYCFCENEFKIKDRLKAAGEELPRPLEDVKFVNDRFRHEMIVREERKDCNVIWVDTNNGVEECILQIVDEVESICNTMEQ